MRDVDGRLQALLQEFQGATLARARVGVGEIFVEFEQPNGVWSLGTGGSQWVLVQNDQPLVNYEDDEDKIDRFDVAIGRSVDGVYPGKAGSGLQVDLGDGLAFFIVRSPDDIAPELPVFELATPLHRTILLHRDGIIDDVPSDVPIRDLLARGLLRHWPSDRSGQAA